MLTALTGPWVWGILQGNLGWTAAVLAGRVAYLAATGRLNHVQAATAGVLVTVAVSVVAVLVNRRLLVPTAIGLAVVVVAWPVLGLTAIDLGCVVQLVLAGAAMVVRLVEEAPDPDSLVDEIRAVGLETFLQTAGCKLVDGPHPTDEHEAGLPRALYKVPRRFGHVRLAVVPNGTRNPESGEYSYYGLPVDGGTTSIVDGVAWSYVKGAAGYAPEART